MACCLTAPSHYLNQCWLWSPVTFIFGQFHKRCLNHQSLKSVWKLHKISFKFPRGQWLKWQQQHDLQRSWAVDRAAVAAWQDSGHGRRRLPVNWRRRKRIPGEKQYMTLYISQYLFSKNSEKTPHSWPVRARYGGPFWVHSLNKVLVFFFSYHVQYYVIFDCNISWVYSNFNFIHNICTLTRLLFTCVTWSPSNDKSVLVQVMTE